MSAIYRFYKYFYANTKTNRARFFNNPIAKRISVVSLTIFGSIIVTGLINNILFTNEVSYTKNKTKYTQDFKYILLWSKPDFAPFLYFGRGQQKFIEKKCSINNCFVTDNRNFFGGNIMKFDAVAFNVRNLGPCANLSDLPQSRSPHQKYIFFASEPADDYPICSDVLDGFFNWTSTYKLDSDIPAPYMRIRNIHGDIVGPKLKMEWVEDTYKVDKYVYSKIQNKSKVAAWFVSNCNTQSVREKYAAMLDESLNQYGMEVDVFGYCGISECPRSRQAKCNEMLERDYYFYLAMENTRTPDYVTEKVLTGLQNYVVPIVFGGARYSRFLPPRSYLNALEQSPEDLARTMVLLMSNPNQYSQYFGWRRHYTYHEAEEDENICTVCAALNNRTMMETSTIHKNLRSWWHPNYRELCKLFRKWLSLMMDCSIANSSSIE